MIIKKDERYLDNECLVAVLCLGLCTALENKAMTTRNAEYLLFNPTTLYLLEQYKASPEAVNMVDLGTELGIGARNFPEIFLPSINDIKVIALSVLQSLPEGWEPEEGWLIQPPEDTEKSR